MRLFSSSDKHSLQKICSQHFVQVNLIVDQSLLVMQHHLAVEHIECQKVKKYLNKNLFKEFIIFSKASYFSLILFILKANEDL